MNLLSLEVKNRKLPLYDDTLKGDGLSEVEEPDDQPLQRQRGER